MINSVSLIVCSLNGNERIQRTLVALAKLQIPSNTIVEIIFIDNGSIKPMIPYVNTLWYELDCPYLLRTFIENKPGKVAALTKGLSYCNGEFILIVDDDNELKYDYLNVGLSYLLQNKKVGVLGGKGVLPNKYSIPDWFPLVSYNFACGPQNEVDGNVRPKRNVVYGAGMWFRKSLFEKAKSNGFNFIFDFDANNPLTRNRKNGGEDAELCWAIIFQGFEVHYLSRMSFYHWLDKSKLTPHFYSIIKSRSINATLLNNLYYRVLFSIDNPVRYFWIKEIIFIFINYFKNIHFSINYFSEELYRNLSNIRVLISMRSDYDKMINNLIEFKNKSKL